MHTIENPREGHKDMSHLHRSRESLRLGTVRGDLEMHEGAQRTRKICYTDAGHNNNNNGRNGSCLTWLATSLEEKRRWLVINASPRGQCSK